MMIWFMFDNHTFRRIGGADVPRAELAARIAAAFEEDGCGSVFGDRNREGRRAPVLHGRLLPSGVYGATAEEIDKFLDEFFAWAHEQSDVRQGTGALERELSVLRSFCACRGDDEKVQEACDELRALRAEITRLRSELQTAHSLGHRLALDLECLLQSTDNPAATRWWDEAQASLQAWRDWAQRAGGTE